MTVAIDTREALGGDDLPYLKSRSLKLSRFTRPGLEADAKKQFLNHAVKLKPFKDPSPLARWQDWLENDLNLGADSLLFAKLNSRLLLHMSGGTMENANILLDRFGYPYLPGSGVKGTARHTLLAAIREWAVEQNREPLEAGHVFFPLTQGYDSPESMLADALMAFGWTDSEWKSGRNRDDHLLSDCEYALGEEWKEAQQGVANILATSYGVKLDTDGLRPSLSQLGRVTFFHAYPRAADYPQQSDLELDVLTCHHLEYYKGNKDMPDALDVENPIPVYFPAVKAGITFLFAIQATDRKLRKLAHTSLKVALACFGTGAKTNAGYGWFDTETEQTRYAIDKDEQEKKEQEQQREQERLASLSPNDIEKERLMNLDDPGFAAVAKNLPNESALTQQAILELLQSPEKRDRWKAWKKKKPDIAKSLLEVAKKLNITLP